MNLLKRLFAGRTEPASAPAVRALPAPARLPRWLEPYETPFGVRVLDCRTHVTDTRTTLRDARQLERFAGTRRSSGELYRDVPPPAAQRIACALEIPVPDAPADGALHRAATTEEKWDVFHFGGWLSFVRPTTGALIYRALAEFGAHGARITQVEANGEDGERDGDYAVAEVDYLLKSHVFGFDAPHPVPPGVTLANDELAQLSFALHGRRGRFATHENALAFDPWAVFGDAGSSR